MNIGLIGSGGREHAICKKLLKSKKLVKLSAFQVMPERRK